MRIYQHDDSEIFIYRRSVAPTGSVGDLWYDEATSLLKKCSNVSPMTWVSVEGGGGAPSGATYITTVSEADLSAEKVLGTDIIMRGVAASRPAAGTAGRLYISSDTGVIERDSGAAWDDVTATPDAHTHAQLHDRSHAVDSTADHTVTGGTSGHVLRQTGATTFAWGAIQDGDLPASITRDAEAAAAYAAIGHTHTLDNLSDVVITAPSTGQVVKFNGTNWVNDTDSTGAGGSNTLYAPGSVTVATGNFQVHVKTLQLTGAQRLAVAGTGRFRIT